MACTGSVPSLGTLILSNDPTFCVDTLSITVDEACGATGYSIALYRDFGGAPVASGTQTDPPTPLPDGPQSGYPFTIHTTPPCRRGPVYYQMAILCAGVVQAVSGIVSRTNGGPADITFSDVSHDGNCVVTTRAQVSKPCGECAGTIKCFRKAGSPVTFDPSEVIYTNTVPAGPLIGSQFQTTDTPGNGIFYYAWRVYADTGGVDDEYNPGYIDNECVGVYNPFTTELPEGQMEKQLVLVQVQKVNGYYRYTDIEVMNLEEQRIEWWQHKNGGCGSFRFLTHDTFNDVFDDVLTDSWELHVRIKLAGETVHTTWYRGIIRSIKTDEQGQEVFTELRGYGYVELLDNVQIQKKYAAGLTVKDVVDDIVDNYVKPNTRIRRPRDIDVTNGDSGVDSSSYKLGSEVHFECSALKAIKFLAELQGQREFGVDGNGCIYFRTVSTSVGKNFYLQNDILKRVAGGKTFIEANDIKVAGKSFGSVNFLQNRQDVTDITANGLFESTHEVPWVTGDKDASQWADNIIAKHKISQTWSVFTWKNVTENLTRQHPFDKIKVYGSDMSNDVHTYDIAKIQYIEGGWITKQEIREMGSPTIQPELDQQLLKAHIYAGYYPRDVIEELEVRIKDQVESLKGREKQYRYPNDVTVKPSTGHIPGELLHYSKDVTNNDVTNNPAELQNSSYPRGVPLIYLDNQWVKISTRRTFNTLPSRGKFIGEIVTLITDLTNQAFGVLKVWSGIAWVDVGTGSGGSGGTSNPVMEGARVNKSTDTTLTSGVATTLTFDTILSNDNGVFGAPGGSKMTAKTNGWYLVSAGVIWGNGINGTYREIRLLFNGTTIIKRDRRDDFLHYNQRTNELCEVIYLLAGEYIELQGYTDAIDGGDVIKASSPYSPLFSMSLLTGGGTFSSAGGNPTGPAGGDLYDPTIPYPNPRVSGLQGDVLPTKLADGFLKRNSANSAWEEVTYGDITNTVVQGNDIRLFDVTNSHHGLVPILTPDADKFLNDAGEWQYPRNPYENYAGYQPQGGATLFAQENWTDTVTNTTTGGGVVTDERKFMVQMITNGGLNARSGFLESNLNWPCNLFKYWFQHIKTGPLTTDVTSIRIKTGFTSQSGGEWVSADDNADRLFGFKFSTAVGDTTWKCVVNDGAANETVANSGVTVKRNEHYYFAIDLRVNGTVKFYINGSLVATISSNVPNGLTAGGSLLLYSKIQALEAVAKSWKIGRTGWITY